MASVLGRSMFGACVLASALISPIGVSGGPAGAAASPCTDTKIHTVKITSKHKQTWHRTFVSTSGEVTKSKTETRRKSHNLGRIAVEIVTCKRDGKWTVFDIDVAQSHQDVSLTVQAGKVTKVDPLHRTSGFMLTHVRTSQTAVQVQAQRCVHKPAKMTYWSALRALTKVPLPGPYSIGVGQFAAGLLLPDAPDDRFWCMTLANPASIPLGIKADGTPYLKWSTLVRGRIPKIASLTYTEACPGYAYCGDTWKEIVTIYRP